MFLISSSLGKIRTYVGSDGKLHFVDASGADSVLPFKNGGSIVIPGDISIDKTSVSAGCVSIASSIANNNIGYVTTLEKINFGDSKVVTLFYNVYMRGTNNFVMQTSDDGNQWTDLWSTTVTTDVNASHKTSMGFKEFAIPENLNNKSKYLRFGIRPSNFYSNNNQVGITIHK